MRTRTSTFGRACFFIGLTALYALVGMKAYLGWRDGVWPHWPLGNQLPDALVQMLFSWDIGPLRDALIWVLSRDVVECAAVVCLLLWALTPTGTNRKNQTNHSENVSR